MSAATKSWGRGIQSIEPSPPGERAWNPDITIAYNGREIDTITLSQDGEDHVITFTYTNGKVTGISKAVIQ